MRTAQQVQNRNTDGFYSSWPQYLHVVRILGNKLLTWKHKPSDRPSLEINHSSQFCDATLGPFVPQLQVGEGRRVVPGQNCGGVWGGAPLQHAAVVRCGQRHAFKHALVKEALHLRPRRSICNRRSREPKQHRWQNQLLSHRRWRSGAVNAGGCSSSRGRSPRADPGIGWTGTAGAAWPWPAPPAPGETPPLPVGHRCTNA